MRNAAAARGGTRRHAKDVHLAQPGGRAQRPFFEEEFPSTFAALNATLGRALEALARHGWIAQEHQSAARLCLEEALVNAIRHGNASDPRRHVRLELTEDGDHCIIRVYDEGSGFQPEQVCLPDAQQPGGRGVCLMKHYMEYIRYDQACKCLEMAFRRGKCAAGG